MNFVALGLLCVVLGFESPEQAVPGADEVRQRVERSLPFLEKGAVEWMQTKKCATCHHVPMMVWTHHEARKQGFAVNDKAVQELESQALTHYLGHPELTPTGQDSGFMEKTLGPGTIYLSLALAANPSPGAEVAQGLQRLRDNFVARQNDDGSWTTKVNQAPLVDGHDAMTMLILAAMDHGDLGDKNRESRERAIRWLSQTPVREQSQPLALRILVAVQSDDKDEALRNVQRLRGLQQEDGGWNQIAGLSTDALATGQGLYALGAAGVPSSDTAVGRAWGFFVSTQQEDGSWLVHTRNPNSHDLIISYYGTGWATLGLIRTLPPPVAAGQ
jgi:hypothetical protein